MRQQGAALLCKRVLDIVLAFVFGTLSLPFIAVLALLLLVFNGRPVLFRQRRPGYKGIPFTLLKFRTMNNRSDPSGVLLPDEHRIGSLGRFIRSLSIDELPQLLNVVRGEISLVGPRPLLMEYLDRYTPEQGRRHDVLPGITGWAQINGRNAITWEEKFALDVWYVDNWSLSLDLKILLLTLVRVVNRQGISQPGHATMEKFIGHEKEANSST